MYGYALIFVSFLLAGAKPMSDAGSRECLPAKTLAGMKDCYRPLILFTPTLWDPRAVEQLRTLNRGELLERDVVVVLITAKQSEAGSEQNNPVGDLPSRTVREEERQQLRERFKVGDEAFAVILVGKDGGEKLRRQRPLTAGELNSTIDAMPMRRHEMSK